MVRLIEQTIRFPAPLVPERDEGGAETRVLSQAYPVPLDLLPDLAPLPRHLLLGCLLDGRLQVHSPITVNLSKEGRNIIAEAPELNEFGFGENLSEAVADLQRAVAELFFTLEQEHARLGSDLQRVWTALQQRIRRRA